MIFFIKKIFIFCGKNSFVNSGANLLFENIKNLKELRFVYKENNIPILEELIEIVKEIKFSIEIAFGTLLLVFILFQPNGLVVFLKQWLPGWNEKLHYTSRKTNNKNGGKSVEKRENTKSSFKSSE